MSDKKPWDGRFSGATAASMEAFSQSVSFDQRLYAQDIAGSKAHARMLARQGVISEGECDVLVGGLAMVLAEIESGSFTWLTELEDVHMNIERRLTELVGEVGGKLHTGRSRNDQVALDFRLYVADRLAAWQAGIREVIRTLTEQAHTHRNVLLPGCTHLQAAQPVSLAHHLLAYCAMLKRDAERLADCAKRTRISPLGAAALAGTTYPLDPASVAEELGFEGVFSNSMDAVSDRDFAMEALFGASLIMTHMSRLCEDIILWANPRFGFVELPDGFATGSSIMPQKKNPDAAELIRGKTGRVYGALVSLLTTMKGLPMAYNRDLQEDKEPFFDADDTVTASLGIMAGMVEALAFNSGRMREALDSGFLNATELADYLTSKGMPFREAHRVTGQAVAHAETQNKGLEKLPLTEFKTFSPLIEEDVYAALDYDAAVARRNTSGGTGPESVAAQIDALQAWLTEKDKER